MSHINKKRKDLEGNSSASVVAEMDPIFHNDGTFQYIEDDFLISSNAFGYSDGGVFVESTNTFTVTGYDEAIAVLGHPNQMETLNMLDLAKRDDLSHEVKIIADAHQTLQLVQHTLDQQRKDIQTVCSTLSDQLFQQIVQVQQTMKDKITEHQNKLSNIHETFLLEPKKIQELHSITQGFDMQMRQLVLFEQELGYIQNGRWSDCAVDLVISCQPFSKSIIKGQTLPMEVQLLIGALATTTTNIKNISPIAAELIYEIQKKPKGKAVAPIVEQNTPQTYTDGGAVRLSLKFPIGTGKKHVNLKFTTTVEYSYKDPNTQQEILGKKTVQSNLSKPFIVTTNSVQWKDSEVILLRLQAFGSKTEITREQFVNTLQIYYLGATKQPLEAPIRPLSADDLDLVINKKLNGVQTINLDDLENFWEWFGSGLEKIRHGKHMSNLYLTGYLLGFAGKEKIEATLLNQPEGTFIVRFSDSYPGKFAVAYVSYVMDVPTIKHYLLKASDTAGNNKTLVDFLKEIHCIKHVLRLNTEDTQNQGEMIFERFPKHEALQEYYTDKGDVQAAEGYEEFPN